MKIQIVTEIDEFFAIVKDKREITIEEVSAIMNQDEMLVERWAKALHEVGMVSLHYPMVHTKNGRIKVKYKHDHVKQQHTPQVRGFLMPAH
jgi:predicted transcriptional regulator